MFVRRNWMNIAWTQRKMLAKQGKDRKLGLKDKNKNYKGERAPLVSHDTIRRG